MKNEKFRVNSVADLTARISVAAEQHPANKRLLVAIAGAPGAGKTTLCDQLLTGLNPHQSTVVVPMDGFHLDNCLLDKFSWRAVKGAPHTFDVGGFNSLLHRISSGEKPVYVPVFDRAQDFSRCAATVVDAQSVVLVEGNYLLLDVPEWSDLAKLFDMTVFIDVPIDVLRQRLIERWLNHGLSYENAVARAESNDLPNGRRVLEKTSGADVIFTQSAAHT